MKKTLLILIIALCAQMTMAQGSSRIGFHAPPPPGLPTTISSFLPATICTLGQYEITIEGTGLNQVTLVALIPF